MIYAQPVAHVVYVYSSREHQQIGQTQIDVLLLKTVQESILVLETVIVPIA